MRVNETWQLAQCFLKAPVNVPTWVLGFRVWGLGFGLGFRVYGLRFRVWGLGFAV